jgi:ABC-type nitrate/sulfonate/bicarbonate transport system substrate-binding protein
MIKHSAKRRKIIGAGAALSVAPFVITPSKAQATPIRFGFQDTSWGSIGMVAEAEDIFRKNGVNVSINRFDSGKAVRDAMIANRIDIGVLGTTPLIVGVAKGDVAPVAMAMYAGRTNSIIVAKNSGIKSIADLKGKKVGSQVGSSTNNVFVAKVLPKFGLTEKDVQIVNSKFGNHVAALAGGSVDAFAGVEPFPSVAVTEGLGVSIIDYQDFDIVPVWLGINTPILESRKKDVLAFLKGWVATIEILNKSPDKATKIVQENFTRMGFTISEKAIAAMLSKIEPNPNYVNGLVAYLKEESELLVSKKQIPAVPDWAKLLANPLVKQI